MVSNLHQKVKDHHTLLEDRERKQIKRNGLLKKDILKKVKKSIKEEDVDQDSIKNHEIEVKVYKVSN